jgi:hypothetical protein
MNHTVGCPGTLLHCMKTNNKKENAIKRDTQRFIREKCVWKHSPTPADLIAAMIGTPFTIGIIGIISSYMYPSVYEQVRNVFGQIESNWNTGLGYVMPKYIRAIDESTFAIPEMMSNIPVYDRLLSLCMFTNEKIDIDLGEKGLRGTLMSLGVLSVGNQTNGLCCMWESVGGQHSDRVSGDSISTINRCVYALNIMAHIINNLPDHMKDSVISGTPLYARDADDNISDEIITDMFERTIVLMIEREVNTYARTKFINFYMWIKKNFKSVTDITKMITEVEKKYKKEEAIHIKKLQLFIRHNIMNAIYESPMYPTYPMLVCALCNIGTTKLCDCNLVRYCSKECQTVHRIEHRKQCNAELKRKKGV